MTDGANGFTDESFNKFIGGQLELQTSVELYCGEISDIWLDEETTLHVKFSCMARFEEKTHEWVTHGVFDYSASVNSDQCEVIMNNERILRLKFTDTGKTARLFVPGGLQVDLETVVGPNRHKK